MNDLFHELASHYFTSDIEQMNNVPFGLTNDSQIIVVRNQKYVARIYNEYSKTLERLRFEIELTSSLTSQNLSFRIPEFMITLDGAQFVKLSNGQFGAVMPFIEGIVPQLSSETDIKQYGKIVGELSAALQEYNGGEAIDVVRFYNLNTVHPLCTEETIVQFLQAPPFLVEQDTLVILREAFHVMNDNCSFFQQLPQQMIHHDVLVFNLLANQVTGKITGVLDFDFASYDIRALELAVCVNHLLQFNDRSLTGLEWFLDEYALYMKLTEEEIKSFPLLMRLYYVSLLCIYIGQHHSGKDIAAYFHIISEQLVRRSQWLKQHDMELIALLKVKLLQAAK